MSDANALEAASTTKLVGAQTDGTEETPIGSTTYREILAYDVANHGGADTELTLVAGQIVELKIGASPRANRKYIMIQALDRNMKWGFSIGTQNFNAYKAQFFMLPMGPDTSVYMKNSGTETGKINIAAVS